eukprot:TRINITY_DN145_c2_g1_i1.p1 TRINITY_DN145_c2_g1~~TRINITY_DN145_c2_g1_i1.p1  ORF type:complete len:294 (+),score=156.82 TRINITY_DN145_c2_g1_i1:122-1003(+)
MASLPTAEIGIIGGTGVYGVNGLEETTDIQIETPFGTPSSPIRIGKLSGITVAFLARHGIGHRLSPSEIPFRANIYALKKLGVKYLLSLSAVGSLQEQFAPLDIVLIDQFIDRTKARQDTFFGNGVVAHVSMAEPACPIFRDLIVNSVKQIKLEGKLHSGGTYICIEGPAFSSKAESNFYRIIQGHVIGMTAVPEIKLAHEAEIAYACVAFVTDYDCWHPDHDSVTVEMVIKTLHKNGEQAQEIVKAVVAKLAASPFTSKAHSACQFSIMTPAANISQENKQILAPIISKYIN